MASLLELHEKLKSSGMGDIVNPPLESGPTMESLEQFLRCVLVNSGEKMFFCPYITAFIDVQKPSELKTLQVASLMKQVNIKMIICAIITCCFSINGCNCIIKKIAGIDYDIIPFC